MINMLPRFLMEPFRPAFETARGYNAIKMRCDAVAGLTVAVVAVPQSMAYAFIAGVPPQYGLYTVILQSFIGSIFNSQRFLSVGPINTQSLLVASTVTRLAGASNPEIYLQLVVALTLVKGLLQVVMSMARLGRLVRYVSHSVIVGFTAGAGVLIAAGQANHFLGFDVERSSGDWPGLIGVVERLGSHLPSCSVPAVILGVVALALMIGLRCLSRLIPGPLIAIAVCSAVAAGAGWNAADFTFVPRIDQGLAVPAVPVLSLERFEQLLAGALALSMLGLMEAYSIGRSLAAKTGTHINANRELFGQGITNFATSFFWCIPGSGSFSRSALNHYAGARTRFAGIFNSLGALAIFLIFAPLSQYIPMSAIAAILFVIAYELIDWRYLQRAIKSNRADAAVCMGTFLATIFVPLAYAVFVGVFLNIALYLRRASQLHITEMVQVPGGLFEEHPVDGSDGKRVRFLQVEGDLFFGVADEFQEELAGLVKSGAQIVIFRLKRTHSMDLTVMTVLDQFVRHLQERGGHVILCGVRHNLMRVMRLFGLLKTIGEANVFETTHGVFASARQALRRAGALAGAPVDLRTLKDDQSFAGWAYDI